MPAPYIMNFYIKQEEIHRRMDYIKKHFFTATPCDLEDILNKLNEIIDLLNTSVFLANAARRAGIIK